MHIKRISILRHPPLKSVSFDCDGRVNLFIGPNASGKSTILRAINSAYSGKMHQFVGIVDKLADMNFIHHSDKDVPFDLNICPTVYVDLGEDWPRDRNGGLLTRWDAVPLLYVPATRVNLPGVHVFDQAINKEDALENDAPLEALFDTASGIFYGRYVELAIEWLLRYYFDDAPGMHQDLHSLVTLGYSCAKSICSEIMYGNEPHAYIEVDYEREISDTGRVVHHSMGIGTKDDVLGEPLYAGALSSGTQGTLLWVWALALKMAHHYDWAEGWEEKPAILLIDEIENHLHPTWQRRVIPALLQHFPKLQIFATTHSPFVVAGLKAGQVHLLKRGEHGSVTASTNTEDVIGWTADEILRTMMDVDEPTDQLTVDRVNRLRQLREKDTLTSKEESELNGLRRQINKDLLAKGGPLEVEREHYADLMQEFLRNRQSELTQDTE